MEIEYVAPQVNLAGEVDRVVLGGIFAGADLNNEFIRSGGDLLTDDAADSE